MDENSSPTSRKMLEIVHDLRNALNGLAITIELLATPGLDASRVGASMERARAAVRSMAVRLRELEEISNGR